VDQPQCRESYKAYIMRSLVEVVKVRRCDKGKHIEEDEISRQYHYNGAVEIRWKERPGINYGVGDLVIEACDGKHKITIENVEINIIK